MKLAVCSSAALVQIFLFGLLVSVMSCAVRLLLEPFSSSAAARSSHRLAAGEGSSSTVCCVVCVVAWGCSWRLVVFGFSETIGAAAVCTVCGSARASGFFANSACCVLPLLFVRIFVFFLGIFCVCFVL